MKSILNLITAFLFGERAHGELTKNPTFRSLYPENQPSENEWYKMFRVSSLHGVQQRIFIG